MAFSSAPEVGVCARLRCLLAALMSLCVWLKHAGRTLYIVPRTGVADTCQTQYGQTLSLYILSPGQGLRTRAKRTTGKQGLRYTPRPEARCIESKIATEVVSSVRSCVREGTRQLVQRYLCYKDIYRQNNCRCRAPLISNNQQIHTRKRTHAPRNRKRSALHNTSDKLRTKYRGGIRVRSPRSSCFIFEANADYADM